MKFERFFGIFKQNYNAEASKRCRALRRRLKTFLALIRLKILAFSLLQFYDAAKAAKKAFTQADSALGISMLSKFTNK